jgi:type III secretion protein J
VRGLGLALLALAACSAEVAGDLDEGQSQEALAALTSAGIAADRHVSGAGKDRRYRLEVAAGDAGRAAAVLRAQGLPRPAPRGFGELYGSASMIPTATEEKARFLEALSGEIAIHLRGLEGVIDSSVIVTQPTEDPLAPPEATPRRPTASVLLRLRAGAGGPGEPDVKRLVAGAVEGMTAADVAVVTVEAPAPPVDPSPFASVGPIRVARSSKLTLVALLGGGCALVMLMGLWILFGERRAARLRAELASLGVDKGRPQA